MARWRKKVSVTHRERFVRALNHEETDRVPLDLGGGPVSQIHQTAYDALLDLLGLEPLEDTSENLLHTSIHHICEKIAQQIKPYITKKDSSIFVTGGGALNHFLIEVLQEKLNESTKVVVPEKELIEFKEALVFALMGALRAAQEINVLKSVTGAKRDSSSGVLYLPT